MGRKPLHEDVKKKIVTVSLTGKLAKILRKEVNYSRLVERLLIEHFKKIGKWD